jgi:hypothetical protein
MADIEIFDITPQGEWTTQKKNMFAHLEALTFRILQKGQDITSNLGGDFTAVYMTYGLFGKVANDMYHKVCSLAKDYNYDTCQDRFEWAAEKCQYKSLRKIINILKYHKIETDFSDEKIEGTEEISIIIPEGVDPNFVLQHGFYPYVNQGKTGYYFRISEKSFAAQSNFVITPLMHILSKTDNKRIIRIDNGFKQVTLDMPSRAMISLENFSGAVVEEGNYLFYGSKIHLMKILNTIMSDFPVCFELKTLGWQPEGFFAWSNAIYQPGYPEIERFDEIGIAEVGGNNYFSPSASNIYSGQRSDDDEYENDRYLRYIETAITFEQWCKLLCTVYPDHGMIGISFVVIALFKDIVYKIDNNCPLLSAYGEKGSGKSKFAESISAPFLNDILPFNLNHGTDFAFFNRLSRFRNCITWMDEFDDQAIKEDRFQALKGAYDGAGRERGKGTNKNKTEIARVNSAVLLTGQYLSTRDDNAALTRCLILPFLPNNNRTKDQINAYDELKKHERKGLTAIVKELLYLRPVFEKNYPVIFPTVFSDLRSAITDSGNSYAERVLRNYAAALTSLKMISETFKLPFHLEDVKERLKNDVIRLSKMISESDSLADFWNTITYLQDTGEIKEGFHFRILQVDSIKLQTKDGDTEKKFPGITKLLILRLGTIHKLYLEAFRKQTGKTGINMQSLELYISSAKGSIGKSRSQRFTDQDGKGMITSCHVFDYELLGVQLEREEPEAAEKVLSEVRGYLYGDPELVKQAGKIVLRYTIMTSTTNSEEGKIVRTEVRTNIIDPKPTNEQLLLTRKELAVQGVLKVNVWQDKGGERREKRTMVAESVELVNKQLTIDETPSPEAPF